MTTPFETALHGPDTSSAFTERTRIAYAPGRLLVQRNEVLRARSSERSSSHTLVRQQLAFALKEPGAERSHLLRGHQKAREAEHGTVVVPGIAAGDIGTDVSELVEVGDVDQPDRQIHESPHLGAGLGVRA